MQKIKKSNLLVYQSDNFSHKHIDYFYTTKEKGVSLGHLSSLNLGFSLGDERENVIKNYEFVAKALNSKLSDITATCQIHENFVSVVTEEDRGRGITKEKIWQSDAIITNIEGIVLAGFYADCVVMLFHDRVKHVIGVAHSGWRGTAKNIIKHTIDKMTEVYGTKPCDISVLIGPSIKPCHFETDEDVPMALLDSDKALNAFIEKKGAKYHIDLQGICEYQLKACGVTNITLSDICTYCNEEDFWSHRRTNGKRGVHGAFIKLEKKSEI